MKLWQHKGLKLTIDFFFKKIFRCGFLAKKTENQVDDYLNKISIKTNVATDEGNSRNEMRH